MREGFGETALELRHHKRQSTKRSWLKTILFQGLVLASLIPILFFLRFNIKSYMIGSSACESSPTLQKDWGSDEN